MADLTTEIIREHEGFRSTPYWDVNNWRIGYGSDTITLSDGSVKRLSSDPNDKPDLRVTREDAERDLARRIPEFQQDGVIAYVGQDAWDALTAEAKAAVTSLAYNYGGLGELPSLRKAIKTGDMTKVANAIEARSTDNDGVNSKRRKAEAALVAGHPVVPGSMPTDRKSGWAKAAFAPRPAPVPAAFQRVLPPVSEVNPLPAPAQLLPRGNMGSAPVLGGTAAPARTPPPAPGEGHTVAHARAEQVGRRQPVAASAPQSPVAAPPAAPLKQIVPATGLSSERYAQQVDNARISGYRSIQERIAQGAAAPAATATPSEPVKRASGLTRTTTGIAGTEVLPVKRPASIPDMNKFNPEIPGVPKYITVQVPIAEAAASVGGGAARKPAPVADQRAEMQDEMKMLRGRGAAAVAAGKAAPQPMPAPKFRTVQQLNPAWVEANKAAAPQAAGIRAPGTSGNYTVRSGDTITELARANGVTAQQLLALNPHISDPNRIYAGEKLNLSSGAKAAPAKGLAATSRPATTITVRPAASPDAGGGTIHTNPGKYGATSAERQANAADRAAFLQQWGG